MRAREIFLIETVGETVRVVREEITAPKILYHQSPVKARERIAQIGLQHPCDIPPELDIDMCGEEAVGIYFNDHADTDPRSDTWAVNVQGLELHPDETTEAPDGQEWFVTYDEVGPERLKLIYKGSL